MAKNGGLGLAVLIVGGLAVLLFFSSTIVGFASGAPGMLNDFVQYIQDLVAQIRGGLPGAGGDVTGSTWVGYTVFFKDGTSTEYRATAPSYSLFPLSISYEGKELSSVRVDLKAKLESDNPLTAWDTNVSMTTEMFKKPESTPRTFATANYSKNGPSWISGETKILASYTVTSQTLEDLVFQYGDGAWKLEFTADVAIIVYSNGVPVDLTAVSKGGMDFNYGFNSSGFSVFGGATNF